LSPFDQAGPKRVSLDITNHKAEMLIIEDGKGLESPLPDMAAMMIVAQVTTNMSRHQPMHPAAEIPVAMWPENEMEVVWHQAIGDDPHR
jgi:hypothetical protein